MEKIRIGIIGVGEVGEVHLINCLRFPQDVVMVGVYDTSGARQAVARNRGAIIYNDPDKLISQCDAVIVSSPTYTHCEYARAVVMAGKHIFLEKPIDVNYGKAIQLRMLIDDLRERRLYNKVIQMGFVMRYGEGREHLKMMIDNGVIGSPVYFMHHFCVTAGANAAWIHELEKGGGVVLEGITHTIDWGNYVFGEVESVKSDLMTLKRDGKAPDTGFVAISYKNGHKLLVTFSWSLDKTGWQSIGSTNFNVIGSKANVRIEGNEAKICNKSDGGVTGSFAWPNGWGCSNESYYREMVNFIRSIRGQENPKAGIKDGLKALKIVNECLYQE